MRQAHARTLCDVRGVLSVGVGAWIVTMAALITNAHSGAEMHIKLVIVESFKCWSSIRVGSRPSSTN